MAQLGTLSVALDAQTAKFNAGLRAAKGSLARFTKGAGDNLVALGASFAGLALATRKVTNTFATFESGMVRAGAIMGANAGEVKQLEQKALDLAKTTKFSGTQVTDAYKFMAMAGMDFKKTADAIGPTLQLAQAGALDLGEAADIVTGIMAGFGMEASELAEVNDVLVTAITTAKTDVSGLGQSFEKVGEISRGVGWSFKEVTAALNIMSKGNLRGAEAGTALRMAIARILPATGPAADALDRLGVKVRNADRSMRPIVDIVKQLEDVGAGPEELVEIFGAKGFRAFMSLTSSGADELRKMTAQLEKGRGSAKKLADIEMTTLAGAINSMNASIEAATVQLGSAFAPAMHVAAGAVGAFADAFAAMPSVLHEAAGFTLLAATSFTGLAASIGAVAKAAPLAIAGLRAIKVASAPLMAVIGAVAALRAGGQMIATATAGAVVGGGATEALQNRYGDTSRWEMFKNIWKGGNEKYLEATEAIAKASDASAKKTGEATKATGAAIPEIKRLGTVTKEAVEAMDFGGSSLLDAADDAGFKEALQNIANGLDDYDFAGDFADGLVGSFAEIELASKQGAEAAKQMTTNMESAASAAAGLAGNRKGGVAGLVSTGASAFAAGGPQAAMMAVATELVSGTEFFAMAMEKINTLLDSFDAILSSVMSLTDTFVRPITMVTNGLATTVGELFNFRGATEDATFALQKLKGVNEGLSEFMRIIGLGTSVESAVGMMAGTDLGSLSESTQRAVGDSLQGILQEMEDELVRRELGMERNQLLTNLDDREVQSQIDHVNGVLETISAGLEEGSDTIGDTVKEMGAALTNVPQWFKTNLERFRAASVEASPSGGGTSTAAAHASAMGMIAALGPGGGTTINVENMTVETDSTRRVVEEIEKESSFLSLATQARNVIKGLK